MESAQALDRFLQQVERRALGMAIIATRNRDDGLEIVQETMLKFAENYAHKPSAEWAPLFFRVLQNQTRDWHRRNRVRSRWRVWFRDKPMDETIEADNVENLHNPHSRDPLVELTNMNALEQLHYAWQQLPSRQQEVFLLRAWEGLNVAQTALAMEISEGSVKTHYSRAIHQLRTQLEGYLP